MAPTEGRVNKANDTAVILYQNKHLSRFIELLILQTAAMLMIKTYTACRHTTLFMLFHFCIYVVYSCNKLSGQMSRISLDISFIKNTLMTLLPTKSVKVNMRKVMWVEFGSLI